MAPPDAYQQLIDLLDQHRVACRLIDHPPEGSFASAAVAERLAGSVAGTILPFAFSPELELIVDPSLFEHDEIYFNAARLDRSVVLKSKDYAALARPRRERIAEGGGPRARP